MANERIVESNLDRYRKISCRNNSVVTCRRF